jgi:hypothetical protein
MYEHLRTAILMVLGLGITQLLASAVEAFRARQRIAFHWIPAAWAAAIFAWQMQFIWAIYELRAVTHWTAGRFLLLLVMALLLFVAGALAVPRSRPEGPSSAWEQFLRDGRWALACLAAFFLLAFLSNPILFGVPLWALPNPLDLGLAAILVATLLAGRCWRWAWAAGTAVFLAGSVAAILWLSPAYG